MSGLKNPISVTVANVTKLNNLVTRFEFKRTDGADLPQFSAGSHVVVEMVKGDERHMNAYSLCSDPNDVSSYVISVRRDDEGRGGSLFMHNNVSAGDTIMISHPVNLFALDLRANKHLLIAGGIGITPFMSHIHQLEMLNKNWELHYTCTEKALASYSEWFEQVHGANSTLYYNDQGETLDIDATLSQQPIGTHVYICGPKGLIEAVRNRAEVLGWPKGKVHFEEFLAPEPGKPFTVKLTKSNKTIQVGETESLLEALEREGIDTPFLCRGGACGQCETKVIEANGTFIHRDHWLEEEEIKAGNKIMPCVSRFEGDTLVLDR